MADVTRDVVARLEVQKDGDATAFRETAEDIAGVGEKAAEAQGPVAEFLQKLGEAGASRDEIEALGPALEDIAKAAENFANAKGIDEQRRSITELRGAWERLGETVQEAFEDGSKAADTFAEGLDALKKVERELAEPLETALKKATAAVKEFGDQADAGGSRAQRAATLAKVAMEQYAAALAEVRRAGGNVTDEQVEALNRLQEAYEKAIRKTADFKNAQEDVGKAIKSTRAETDVGRGSINDLGDIVERVSPKLGDLVAKGFAIAGAFEAGWAAGSKLRQVLNDLSDGGFDKGIQEFITRALDLDEGLSSVAETGERVRAMMNVLEKNGIDPLGKSLAELEEAYNGLIQSKREAAAATEQQASAEEKATTGAKKTREEISEQQKAIDSLTKEILGPGQAAQVALADQAEVSRQAFSKLGDMTQLNGQQMERLREQVQSLVDRFRSSKEDIPAWLIDAADSSGVFVAAMERAGGKIETFIGKAGGLKGAELAAELQRLEKATDGVGEGFAAAGQEAGKGLEQIGSGAEAVAASSDKAAGGVQAIKTGISGLAESVAPAATAIDQLAAALAKLDAVKLAGIRAEVSALRADIAAAAAELQQLTTGAA